MIEALGSHSRGLKRAKLEEFAAFLTLPEVWLDKKENL